MLAARRVGVGARTPRGPRQLTPKLPPYVKSLLHLPPRPPARLRLFLAPRPDLQPLYVAPSRFFSKLRDPKALSAKARARDNLRPQQRTPDDADAVFQDIQAKDGATLTEVLEYALGKRVGEAPKAVNAAMAATSKEKQHAAVLRAWDAMPDGHYKATPWEYTSALVAAVHLRQKKRLFEILDEVKTNEVEDDHLHGRVVGAACRTKQHELVCEILDYMHASGVDTTGLYVSAHRIAFKSGEYDFVLELLRLMKTHGMDPTGGYKHHLMSLHKAGLHDRVQNVFESIRNAGCVCDEKMYETAVDSAIRVNNHDLVMSILDGMKRDEGLSKSLSAVFSRSVGVAVLTNQPQLVLDVFDFMARTDMEASAAYFTAIRTAFKSKQYDFVFDILRNMTENGVDASEEYSRVVMSFNKLEYYDQVLRAFKGMRECGYEGGERFVRTAVQAAIKTDRHDDVMAISNHDGGQYTSALVAAIRLKQKKQVFEILDEVKVNEVKDDNLYGRVVGAACQAKQHELVCEILDYMHANGVDCTSAYVAARRVAFKSGEYDFVLQLLRLMKTHGMDPTEQYKHQIRSLHKAGLHDRVQSVFEAMRKAGCVRDEEMYGAAADSAIRVKNRDLVMSILDDMKQDAELSKPPSAVFPRAVEAAELTNEHQFNEVKDDKIYGRAVGAACQTKQHELVCEILDYMHANGVDTTGAYIRAYRLAFKSGEYDFVLQLLRLMKTHGMDPTEQYKHHIMSLRKAGLHDRVESVFEAMRKAGCVRDEEMYGAAADSAIRVKNRDLVMSILDDMKQDAELSKPPSAVFPRAVEAAELTNEHQFNEVKDDKIYGRAVGAACQTKQHELVCEILDYMHANGVDTTGAYIRAYRLAFKSGEYDFVLQLLRRMKTHGMDPTGGYKHHLMSLHKADLHDRVQSVFESMRKAGGVCDKKMYDIAVDSAIRVKNHDLVMSILDDMKRNAGLPKTPTAVFRRAVGVAVLTNQPQLVLDMFDFMARTDMDASAAYVTAIKSAFKSKQYDFVFDVLRKMTENGVDASEEYSHAVMLFSKLECHDRAYKALRELGYSSNEQYKHQIRSLHKAGLHDRLLSVFETMRNAEKGFCDEDVYGSAVDSAIRVKNRDLVMSILDDMQRDAGSSKTPTAVFSRAVGVAVLTNQPKLVLDMFDFMARTDIDASAAYVTAIRTAFKSKQYDFVFDILRKMTENGVDASEEYSHAVMLFSKLECYDQVLRAFKAMRELGYSPTEQYKHQIRSLHKAGLHDRLLSVFEAMRNAEKDFCDEDVYGSAVDSAIRVKNRDLVMSILDDMQRDAGSSKTPTAVFSRAVGVAVLTNQPKLVLDVFDFMARTDMDASAAYVTAIRTAFKSKQYDFVFDILRKMTENGVDASEEYSHAVMSFSKLECYDQVLRAFKAMRELGYEQEKIMCTTALRAAIKLDRHDDVIAICDGLSGKSSVTTPLHSHALEQAHSSIMESIKKSTSGAE